MRAHELIDMLRAYPGQEVVIRYFSQDEQNNYSLVIEDIQGDFPAKIDNKREKVILVSVVEDPRLIHEDRETREQIEMGTKSALSHLERESLKK